MFKTRIGRSPHHLAPPVGIPRPLFLSCPLLSRLRCSILFACACSYLVRVHFHLVEYITPQTLEHRRAKRTVAYIS